MFNLDQIRQYRLGPFTIFDSVTAYLGILILSPLLIWLFAKIRLHTSLVSWLWLTLPISILFHLLTGQNTPLMKILSNPFKFEFYFAFIVLFTMTYMGIKGIKKSPKI